MPRNSFIWGKARPVPPVPTCSRCSGTAGEV